MSPDEENLARDLARANALMVNSVRLHTDGNDHASDQARRNARALLKRHGSRGAAILREHGDTSTS